MKNRGLNKIDRTLSGMFDTYRWLRGYRVIRAGADDEIEGHDQLVQKIFFQSGVFDSADTQLANEADGSLSQPLVIMKNDQPVGALTIVENHQQLPVEEYFNIELPAGIHRSQVAEITRYVIEHDHHLQNPVVSLSLLTAAWRYSTQHRKTSYWLCCLPSLFLLGLQPYCPDLQILEQLPLQDHHRAKRLGRESFFDPARRIRVVLIKLSPGMLINAAKIVLTRRFERDRHRLLSRLKRRWMRR